MVTFGEEVVCRTEGGAQSQCEHFGCCLEGGDGSPIAVSTFCLLSRGMVPPL